MEAALRGAYPFRCPAARPGDDIDHLLSEDGPFSGPARGFPTGMETNPFLLYRELGLPYRAALAEGMRDEDYQRIVKNIDNCIAEVDGHGFLRTPFTRARALEARIGYSNELWVKDETNNVSGSHKGRHLMGILLYLEVIRALGLPPINEKGQPPLAIASCGNAALAASVLARAAGRSISVFIPEQANPRVVQRLEELGADIHVCPRAPGERGDPCVYAFQAAVAREALPFCCQGNENGMTIDGGKTIGFEMISSALEGNAVIPDTVFVQVGGGALASALIQSFRDGLRMGAISSMPRVCTVQTQGGFPLKRAYDRIVEKIEGRLGLAHSPSGGGEFERAARIRDRAEPALIEEELHWAAVHRSQFMKPWESEPQSIAGGILDDETYDWLAIVRGMLLSGGFCVVASEKALEEAWHAGREAMGVDVDATGSAGLAGFLECQNQGLSEPFGRIAVLFTGRQR